jgi:2-C-methyl-D-erythritol 4-phosphate cytidylyltransferase
MRASAIVVAAGSGSRLKSDTPKAFVRVAGHPMLYYSLRAIGAVRSIVEAVIALPAETEQAARQEVMAAGLEIPVKLTGGGAQRRDSVRIALELTSAESDLVIVHDAARPFAPPALFETCLEAAARAGGAIAAIPVSDTLKRVDDQIIRATVARAGLYRAQTPQAFRRELLIAAHRNGDPNEIVATDDAELVERIGGKIEIVEGSATNLKITTPADLDLAEAMAKSTAMR